MRDGKPDRASQLLVLERIERALAVALAQAALPDEPTGSPSLQAAGIVASERSSAGKTVDAPLAHADAAAATLDTLLAEAAAGWSRWHDALAAVGHRLRSGE